MDLQPGDFYGTFQLFATNGTITNSSGANINMYARSPNSDFFNTRELRASVQNDGTITSFTSDGLLGGAGKSVTNSGTGIIQTDHSAYNAASRVPKLTITGTSFTNSGALDVGANDGGFGGGLMIINSDTIDLNSGSTITGPGTLILGGNTVNINSGTSISGLNVLGFGRNNAATVVNWDIPDLTDAMTFRMDAGGAITLNRTGAWNIPNNQVLEFYTPSLPINVPMSLTLDQDVNNSGLVRMGQPQPGDNYVQAHLNLTGTSTFTNNADGVVDMWPRGPASGNDPTWNIRNINANVQNDGTINVYAANGRLGTTGKTVVNDATINIDSSFFNPGGKAQLQAFGDTFTNSATGTIDLNAGRLWINTPTFDYDGSITANAGSEIMLGSEPIDNIWNWNGAEITGPVTFRIMPAAMNTINRSSTWNILSGQALLFETGASSSQTGLTINQDITNSGLIQLGRPQPGDNFVDQRFIFTSANSRLTNNADGEIVMYPRSATVPGDPWSIRRIEGELINDGQVTVFNHRGFLGKAGMNHVNNGTITLDNSAIDSPNKATLNVTGDSILNDTAGTIEGDGIFNVTATTFNNAGTLSPGLSAGILTVQGNVNFLSGSVLDIEITGDGGVAGVDYDQLIITGNANGLTQLDLVVDVDNSFGFMEDLFDGDVFTILTSGNDISGQMFNSVTFTGLWTADVNFLPNAVTLTNLTIFVPEPSSFALVMLGAAGMAARRHRSRRQPKTHHSAAA